MRGARFPCSWGLLQSPIGLETDLNMRVNFGGSGNKASAKVLFNAICPAIIITTNNNNTGYHLFGSIVYQAPSWVFCGH